MAMQPPTKTSSAHRSTFLRGTHQFDIIGYSKRKALVGSNTVRSGDFEAGGSTWALVCCFAVLPGGDPNPHQCQLASIFLELVSSNDYVIAKASLRIDDPTPPSPGRRLWPPAVWRSAEAHAFPPTAARSVDDEDVSGASSWKLSIPDAFRESLYVKDDRLTIHCTVDVLLQEKVDTSATRNCFASVAPPPSISRDLRKLLPLDVSKPKLSGMPPFMTDVTFVVEQTEIQAHRLVLAMRSPVFNAELLGGMKESATCARITIDDMRASTFKAMLFFIYTDELPPSALKPKNDNVAATTSYVTTVGDLLVAADRYDLERLRLMCEKILAENLDAASAMTTLMLVHGRDRCRQLEASCVEYMASDPAAVVATKEYTELKERCGPFVTDVLEKVWMMRALAVAHNSPSSSSSSSSKTISASMFNSSQVFTGSHEFRIPNFGAVHKMFGVNNEYIESGTFQIGGHDMSICVYPSGCDGDGYIDMLLAGAGTTNALVSASFRIDDPSGRSPPQIRWAENIYHGPHPCFGVKRFMDVTSTKLYYVRYDGSLTIHCNVTVSRQHAYSTPPRNTGAVGATAMIIPPPSNIAYHLEQLVLSGQCFDVKFLVQDSQLCAHELVIAARSPTLHGAISSAPDKDHVRIDDIDIPAFRAVLHFIYTDELPVIMLASDAAAVVARDLLVAADRFGLERMKAMCETMICEQITTQNVVATLELADRRRFQGLKDFCLDHIAQPHVLKEAMETDGFKGLKATSPWLLEEILVKISELSSMDL